MTKPRATTTFKAKDAAVPFGSTRSKAAKLHPAVADAIIFAVVFEPGTMGVEFQSGSGSGSGCVVHRVRSPTDVRPGDRVVGIDGQIYYFILRYHHSSIMEYLTLQKLPLEISRQTAGWTSFFCHYRRAAEKHFQAVR